MSEPEALPPPQQWPAPPEQEWPAPLPQHRWEPQHWAPPQWAPPAPPSDSRPAPGSKAPAGRKGIGGALVAAAAAAAKWGAILFKLKAFTFAASMLVSIAAYAWLWGWQFAVGFVLLIAIHEFGHVVALRFMGIRATAPMFIPFLGAFVSMKEQPRSAWHEAVSGIAGPAAGAAAAGVCWWYADASGSGLFLALAFSGFFLNLFNLLPMLPLDGGRAAAAIHPAMWVLGLVGLVALFVYHPNVIIVLILVLGIAEVWRRYRGRSTAESRAYYQLTNRQRATMTFAYFALIAVLVVAMHGTYVHRTFS